MHEADSHELASGARLEIVASVSLAGRAAHGRSVESSDASRMPEYGDSVLFPDASRFFTQFGQVPELMC